MSKIIKRDGPFTGLGNFIPQIFPEQRKSTRIYRMRGTINIYGIYGIKLNVYRNGVYLDIGQ